MKTFFKFSALVMLATVSALLTSIDQPYAQTTTRDRTVEPAPTVSPTPPRFGEDDEVIKIDTELVNINVRVVDRFNRPINNLRQSDFKIFEDGTEQRIEFFSQSEVPTNYALVVDNSGSLRPQIIEVIDASKIIVNTNRPDDETAIIRFVSSDKIEVLQNFTDNKEWLNDALEKMYVEGGRTAVIDAVYLAVEKVSEYEKETDAVDRKRRALVLVTDGEDVSSFYTQAQLFDLLKESDVQIYVIGFLDGLDDKSGFISRSPRARAKSFLDKLAADTGGRAYYPASLAELKGIAEDIASEMRSQYSIGYIPTNDRDDGTYRNIRVTVADGPNRERRIPITRAGRTAGRPGGAPSFR
jgi:Ca-activated chloride channel homolog